MDNISNLLQEAKPLYVARKKRKNLLKAFSCILLVSVSVGLLSSENKISYDPSWEYGYYNLTNGSIIEDMGLPIDDYGFLSV